MVLVRGPLLSLGRLSNNNALVALVVIVLVYLDSFGDLSYIFKNTCEIYHK